MNVSQQVSISTSQKKKKKKPRALEHPASTSAVWTFGGLVLLKFVLEDIRESVLYL